MSRAIVERVDQVFPALLETNIGATCFRYLQLVKATLEAAGHKVQFVTKTNRDGGQYVPPGFGQREIRGTDGNRYIATGVSHDVLYVDDEQRDLIISGNYYDHSIFDDRNKPVRARPKWGEPIPRHEYRPWNPPLPLEFEKLFAPVRPVPVPLNDTPARELEIPSYGEMGDDKFFVDKVGAFVAEEMGQPRCRDCGSHNIEGGMNAGSASWIARTVHSVMRAFIKHRDHRDADAIALKHRNEMRGVLNRPPL